ncbi:VirB8/TrbF family protein [Puniceibacterium antarcticum]|uniref:VirB8/TrbF family protein n=1 Tax=Puniceibacterium antarcticum TaxID=1206336 RepID=UPI000C187C67
MKPTFWRNRKKSASRPESKSLGWGIAGVASLLVVSSAAAAPVMAPLKQVVFFVLRVDHTSGVPEVMTSLSDGDLRSRFRF